MSRKQRRKNSSKNKPATGPIDQYVRTQIEGYATPRQTSGKRIATTPTDELHQREAETSKSRTNRT